MSILKYQSYPGIQRRFNEDEMESRLECLKRDGFFLWPDLIDFSTVSVAREALDLAWEKSVGIYGEEFLRKIGDWGQVRGLLTQHSVFLELLIHQSILDVVDKSVGRTSILHLQNGIVLYPNARHNQAQFHRDFPKDFLSSKILSLNAFILLDDFTVANGGTWLIPGSHIFEEMPSEEYLSRRAIQIQARAGSVLFFDSMLWHKGGENSTTNVRRAINQQYTRPFIKQQLDYPKMTTNLVDKESRLAQVLGHWSVTPSSVEEYRVSDPALRTYRSGQG